MKFSTYIATIALAMAGLVSGSTAATISAALGDLVLGFQASGGTGASKNVEVAIGTFTSFNTAFTNSSTFQVADLNADLTATYGSNWNTRTDLTWSFAGNLSTALTLKTVYLSKVETTVGTQASAFAGTAASTLANAAGNIGKAITGINTQTSSTNSNLVYVSDNNTGVSYTDAYTTSGVAYGVFTATDVSNSVTSSGKVVSDLYRLTGNTIGGAKTVAYFGSFALDSAGILTYASSAATFAAVPEPSTYAAIFGVVMLGFAAYRRRFQK